MPRRRPSLLVLILLLPLLPLWPLLFRWRWLVYGPFIVGLWLLELVVGFCVFLSNSYLSRR